MKADYRRDGGTADKYLKDQEKISKSKALKLFLVISFTVPWQNCTFPLRAFEILVFILNVNYNSRPS